MITPRLPKLLYVHWADDTNEPYLLADIEATDAATMGEVKNVGVYELKERVTVEGVAKITPKEGKARRQGVGRRVNPKQERAFTRCLQARPPAPFALKGERDEENNRRKLPRRSNA